MYNDSHNKNGYENIHPNIVQLTTAEVHAFKNSILEQNRADLNQKFLKNVTPELDINTTSDNRIAISIKFCNIWLKTHDLLNLIELSFQTDVDIRALGPITEPDPLHRTRLVM